MDNALPKPSAPPRNRRINNDRLLAEISAFCQRVGMAESTFGRRVVNDGKLVSRLRFGGRITTQTEERIASFIARTLDERIDSSPSARIGPGRASLASANAAL